METRASYVLIGAFALAVMVLGLVFALWIGKTALDREWDEYRIVFTEAVTGLTVGGAVQYNGIQVGEVRRLSLDPEDPRRVFARVRVTGGTPIKTDTRAKLTFTGLTGVAVIQLTGGTPQAPPLTARAGEDVPTIVAEESALQKLLTSSEDVVTSFNDVMLRLSLLLRQENLDNVAATLDHLEQVTGAVAERSEGIGQAIADITEASRAMRETLAQTEQLIARVERAAAGVERVMDEDAPELLASARESLDAARRATESAYATIEENRGAIAQFSQQGLTQVGPAAAELRATLENLRRITAELERDPSGYLLGREQPREYSPQ